MRRISRRTFVERTAALAGGGLIAPIAAPLAQGLAPAPLAKRAFGKTGEKVTLVGLGGGSRFYEPVPDDELGAEIVRRAIDAGVGVVETSSVYGDNGESERRIGLAMRTHRSRVFLETKIDSRDYDGAMKEIERSLKRLQTDRLDLLLHHYVLNGDELKAIAGPQGAERAIRKLVAEKVVRFRGFSCHLTPLTLEAITTLEPDAIQVPLNAVRVPDFEGEVLPVTSAKGIAVVAMKTSGHGYFVPKYTTKPDRIERFGPPAEALARPEIPTHRDYLHYALSLPIATAVVGMDSLATVDAVVANARGFRPLERAAMDDISRRAQGFKTAGYWVTG